MDDFAKRIQQNLVVIFYAKTLVFCGKNGLLPTK